MKISDIVRNRRNEIGYTQRDVVNSINCVSMEAYGEFERGNITLSADRFIAICKVLRLNLTDFEDCELHFGKRSSPDTKPSKNSSL